MSHRASWVVRGIVTGVVLFCFCLMGCSQQKTEPPVEEPPKAEAKPAPPPPPPAPAPVKPAPAPTAKPTPASGTEYIVQKGDTLFSIAKRFNVKMSDLQAINNIADPNVIKVGQKLIIPAP